MTALHLLALLMTLRAPATPGAAAPAELRHTLGAMKATKSGVDAANNLWMWNAVDRSVTRFAPDGTRTVREGLPGAVSVDADAARGIAILLPDGESIQFAGWDGSIGSPIHLPHAVADIAWWTGNQVVLTPRFGAFRVEVWDAKSGQFSRSLMPSDPMPEPTNGAKAARATFLRYDAAHHELVAFDAFYGDLTIYSDAGAVVRTAAVTHPDRPRLDVWIAQQAAEASPGRPFTPLVFAFAKLTVDAAGTIWLAEKGDEQRGTIAAVRIARNGKPQRVTIESPGCASVRFEAWLGDFIFYRDPKSPLPACVGVRRES